MRIGILTVHRAYNYGSVLQCYALQEYLKAQGHDVWVIDYRQPWTEAIYRTFSLYYIRFWLRHKYPRAIIDYIRNIFNRHAILKKRKKIFSSFQTFLQTTHACKSNLPQDFDIYMIGSDQLWSHQCVGGEDPIYQGFFKHPINSKVIGYAISTNQRSLQQLGADRLKRIVNNFHKLAMREKSNSLVVKELIGIEPALTVDPTILAPVSIWDSMINHEWATKKYIAIYQARPVAGDPFYLKNKAKQVADNNNWEIYDLSQMLYPVHDFISIIKYAQCVYTTSYHATVFSVLMKTPCVAIKLNDGLDVRYVDLLNELGLSNAIVEKNFLPGIPDIDYSNIDQSLAEYRKNSKLFLANL